MSHRNGLLLPEEEIQTLKLEVKDLTQRLKSHVAQLNDANETIQKLSAQISTQRDTLERDFENQKATLQKSLDEERQNHEFTRMELEEETRKVALGVEIIRKQQKEVKELELKEKSRLECEALLRDTSNRLEEREKELIKLRVEFKQGTFSQTEEKNMYLLEKKTLEGTIQLLKTQLNQVQEECKTFEQLFRQNQENWRDEEVISGSKLNRNGNNADSPPPSPVHLNGQGNTVRPKEQPVVNGTKSGPGSRKSGNAPEKPVENGQNQKSTQTANGKGHSKPQAGPQPPSGHPNKAEKLKNGAIEAHTIKMENSESEDNQIYSFKHVEAAKAEMFQQIKQLSGEGKLAGIEDTLLNILSRYHSEIARQFHVLEAQVKLEHEFCESTRQQLELERQNEDLLMEAVSNLQEQLVQPTHSSEPVSGFGLPVATTQTSTTTQTPEKS